MIVYNSIDEKDRMTRLPTYYLTGLGQYDSHTVSYLWARTMMKECCAEPMGLDQIIPGLLNDDYRDPNEFSDKVKAWEKSLEDQE